MLINYTFDAHDDFDGEDFEYEISSEEAEIEICKSLVETYEWVCKHRNNGVTPLDKELFKLKPALVSFVKFILSETNADMNKLEDSFYEEIKEAFRSDAYYYFKD